MKFMEKIKSKKLSKVILGSIIAAGIAVPQIASASTVAVYIGTGVTNGLEVTEGATDQTVTGSVATTVGNPIYVKDSYTGSGSAITLDKGNKSIYGLARNEENKTSLGAYIVVDTNEYLAIVTGVKVNYGFDANNGTVIFRNNNGNADFVYGGLNLDKSKNTLNNTVTIENTYKGNINYLYGARSKGKVESNYVNVYGGRKYNSIYGGMSNDECDVLKNIVVIDNSLADIDYIYGGNSNGKVYKNEVTLKNGTVKTIQGGVSNATSVEGNKVYIKGGTVNGNITGGTSNYGKNAENNEVEIAGGSLDVECIRGAFLRSSSYNCLNNSVVIKGGTVKVLEIVGAEGVDATKVNVTDNSVSIRNVELGYSTSHGYTNDIKIAGGKTGGVKVDGTDSGRAERNTVELDQVKVGQDYRLKVYGGYGNENVEGNSVIIKHSTIEDQYSASDVIGGYTYAGNVKDNTVTIEDSKVKGRIYAAIAGSQEASGVNASFESNKIVLKGALDLSTASLYGWNGVNIANIETKNNALILDGLTGNSNSTDISSIKNFNVIDFGNLTLGTDNATKGYINLTSTSSNLNNTTITANSINGEGYLLTGYFSAKDITFDGALAGGGGELVTTLTEGGVKVGTSSGSKVEVKNTKSDTAVNNYIKVTATGATTYDLMAGKYINAKGKESGSGTLTLSDAPESTITTVAGAYSKGQNDSANGKLSINGGTINAVVYGNYSERGNATGDGKNANVVIKDGATVEKDVFGGWGRKAVSGNIVNILGGSTFSGIYGGQSRDTNGSTAENNIVNISGGVVGANSTNQIAGGCSSQKAVNNQVNISGGTVKGEVYGNYAPYYQLYLGAKTAIGDGSTSNVKISGGTVNGNIYGGSAYNGTASKNIVEISGGTVIGTVTAGYGKEVKDNKVIITQGEKFHKDTTLKDAKLVGSSNGVSQDSTNNNNLEIKNLPTGTVIGGVSNFNNINFGYVDLNGTRDGNGYIKLSDSYVGAHNLNYATITADYVKVGSTGEGYLITGNFSAKDVKFGGALAGGGSGVEVIDTSAGYVKVGTSGGSKVKVGDSTSDIPVKNNFIKVSVIGATTYDLMAGKYINAEGQESVSGTLTLSANPESTIKTIAGAYSKHPTKEVSGGTLNISGGTYAANVEVFGGYSDGGVVKGNHLNISGGTFGGSKELVINGGSKELVINGGYSNKSLAEGNEVSISGTDTTIKGVVYSGYSNKGATNNNILKISGGTIDGTIYGARAWSGDAIGNKVEISGGTIKGAVFGGDSYSNGNEYSNTVKISGGTIQGSVYAGCAHSSEATQQNKIVVEQGENFNNANTLKEASLDGDILEISNLNAGTVIKSVKNFNTISFGDVALNSTASYLTINGGSLNGTVITAGKLSGEGYLISGISTDGVNVDALKGEAGKDKVTALTNGVQYAVGGGTTVTVNETSIHVKANAPDTVKAVAGVFYGDDGKAEIGNTKGVLTLDDSVTPVKGVIYAGAYAKKGKASGGTVKLTDNFAGTVYGGFSENGDTENNTLEIDGSKSVTVTSVKQVDTINVTGKVAKNAEAVLTITDKANFEETDINIAGLELEGAVKDTTKYNIIANANVVASKVTIKNLAKVENNVVKANIINKDVTNGLTLTYGGKVVTGSYTDEAGTVTANGGVLRVSAIGTPEEGVIYTGAYSTKAAPSGIVDLDSDFAGKLYGGYKAGDGTGTLNVRGAGLKVNEIANFNTINFYVPATLEKDGTVLTVANKVDLNGTTVNAGINNKSALDVGDEITLLEAVSLNATGIVAGKVTENDFVDYDMNIEAANNQLKAKITSKGISNENSKSPVETIAGGVVMLNMGADQLSGKGLDSAAEAAAAEKAAASNTMTTFASVGGNKVKAKTGSHVDIKGWNFNMGLAKEIDNKAGKLLLAPVAEYGRGSYDSYIEGAGKTVHADGSSKYWGAGVMARQTNDSGFYYEGSLVGGKSTNDYSTKDIGTGISYDTSAMYMTAHLGAGKIVELGDKDKLNYYGKFFYSRLGSDDTTLSNGAKYSFDASESKRMRLGGRWTREVNTMSSLYAGMAWQYEFDAESRATVNGKTAQAPTMKGHTGIFELGWNVKPDNAKFDVDLSFLGYTGKQKGGSLNVNMNWKF